MRINIEGLEVLWPYPRIYPEQYDYMLELKRALDAKGHCVLEMPTGTGKTVSLLSLITSYQYAQSREKRKLIYCTRTVPEMTKVIQELKSLVKYRSQELGESAKLLAVCLSSRRNMCIHPEVSAESEREKADALCRGMTASWVRAKAESEEEFKLCDFFENFERNGSDALIGSSGVYNLEDLKQIGREHNYCPYFLARHLISYANVIVYNYQYMLDPKVAGLVSRELERESIVVFDEAHNIDNNCIESLSVNLDRRTLDGATRNLNKLATHVNRVKQTNSERLNEEYRRLVQGLADSGALRPNDQDVLANPVLSDDILTEAVPGNIRRAEHFVAFMRRVVEFIKNRLNVKEVITEGPRMFLKNIFMTCQIEAKPMRFSYSRLNSLLRTLEITDVDEFTPLQLVADFATLVATPSFVNGYIIIIEPFDSASQTPDPILQLSCLDASLAIKPVFERFQSVILTSGTLSPLDLYPRILNFQPVISHSFPMSMTRSCIRPLIITRGSDQIPLTSKFDVRGDPAVTRNYGALLVDLAKTVPDGIVCFFTSYRFMEMIVSIWNEMGILEEILKHKLIFIETKDIVETTIALENYKKACDCGRGAIFLSVARGKVAEGIDFDRHFGRCVVLFGIPFQYTLGRVLRARLEYLRDAFNISESDFLVFDALRQAAQCVGRVIRSKTDYGLMVFADKRFNRHDKLSKLPGWIRQFMKDSHLNLSTDMGLSVVRQFLKEMAQPFDEEELSHIMLDEKRVKDLQNRTMEATLTFNSTTSMHDNKMDKVQSNFETIHLEESDSYQSNSNTQRDSQSPNGSKRKSDDKLSVEQEQFISKRRKID